MGKQGNNMVLSFVHGFKRQSIAKPTKNCCLRYFRTKKSILSNPSKTLSIQPCVNGQDYLNSESTEFKMKMQFSGRPGLCTTCLDPAMSQPNVHPASCPKYFHIAHISRWYSWISLDISGSPRRPHLKKLIFPEETWLVDSSSLTWLHNTTKDA